MLSVAFLVSPVAVITVCAAAAMLAGLRYIVLGIVRVRSALLALAYFARSIVQEANEEEAMSAHALVRVKSSCLAGLCEMTEGNISKRTIRSRKLSSAIVREKPVRLEAPLIGSARAC